MKTRRLLYLTAQQTSAYLWRSGVLVCEQRFAASEVGHREFAAYVASHRHSVYTILANVAEESFHIESIPFLRGAERKVVIARKLAQTFFNKAMTAALSLGYENSKRKDERLLLAALNDSDAFKPWLAALKGAHAALAGIFSLPLLTAGLLKMLARDSAPCLLLMVQDESVRQSYFADGELRFSRLAALHDASHAGIAEAFASESRKLRQYLASQRLLARNDQVTTFLLAHREALPAIREVCLDSETTHYEFIPIDECARVAGVKRAPATSHCEEIFLHRLVTDAPPIQFADDDQRHDHNLGRLRSLLHVGGALALVACLLLSGKLLLETTAARHSTAALVAEAQEARARHDAIVARLPKLPTTIEALRRTIDRYHALRRATPDELYRVLSRGLDAVPAAQVESLVWQARRSSDTALSGAEQAAATSPPLNDAEALVVHGSIDISAGSDARATLAVFATLMTVLEGEPAVAVEVLRRPFDIESAKTLKGGAAGLEAGASRGFALSITRRSTS